MFFWPSKHRSVSAVTLGRGSGYRRRLAGVGGVWPHARVPHPLPGGGEGSEHRRSARALPAAPRAYPAVQVTRF